MEGMTLDPVVCDRCGDYGVDPDGGWCRCTAPQVTALNIAGYTVRRLEGRWWISKVSVRSVSVSYLTLGDAVGALVGVAS